MGDLFASIVFPLAQAGGGGSFGGGGGGGGGFGGGGGGGFGGGGFSGGGGGSGEFSIEGFIVLMVILAVATLIEKGREKKQAQKVTRTIRQGVKVQEQALQQQALAAIAGRDPGFDIGVFLQRAAKGFVTTQYAWSEQDLRTCRAFISDGVHERFGLYIAMQKAEDIRNRMRDVSVTNWQVVAVGSDDHFDTIHVRITARAISYNESLSTGRRVSGNSDREPITFTEIWSFSRRPGVQTRTDASLLEGTCPNCGSALEIVDRAKCRTCDSIVNSGAYDWVLSEITQDEEWIVPSARPVIGLDSLKAKDPALNVQHLEDRASVIYWRCMMAVYFEDISYGAPVLPPGVEGVPSRWDPGQGQYWFTPAVGSVEVLGAVTGDDTDRVKVQVRWSATRASGDRRRPNLQPPQRIYTDVIVLRRKAGVTSHIEHTFTSFSCTNCGGPLDVGKMTECKFCGTAVNDGSTDWVVDDVVAPGVAQQWLTQEQVRQRQAAAARGPSALAGPRLAQDRLSNDPNLLIALTRLAAADGHLHEKEKAYLTEMATAHGVPIERVQQAIASGEASTAQFGLPTDPGEARAFMDHLIRGALVDGEISDHEHDLLSNVALRLGWTKADLKQAIKRERKDMYQQARDIVKHAPAPDPRFDPPPPPSGPTLN